MSILAIDPGSEESAFVLLNDPVVLEYGKVANSALLSRLRHMAEHDHVPGDAVRSERCWACHVDVIACEFIQARGMPTSNQEFETMFYTGRFAEAAVWLPFERVFRRDVKTWLCPDMGGRAKDSNIRAALIDRWGGTGGKRKAVGLKADPGPLYGISTDVWQALAVGVTYHEKGVS